MIRPMVDTRAARGDRIRQVILNSGKSQREIAELIGVAPQSITKWIKTGKIYIDNLESLASVTGADMRYIASGYRSDLVAEPSVKYITARSNLLDIINELDDHQANKLLVCARALVDADPDIDLTISVGGKKV